VPLQGRRDQVPSIATKFGFKIRTGRQDGGHRTSPPGKHVKEAVEAVRCSSASVNRPHRLVCTSTGSTRRYRSKDHGSGAMADLVPRREGPLTLACPRPSPQDAAAVLMPFTPSAPLQTEYSLWERGLSKAESVCPTLTANWVLASLPTVRWVGVFLDRHR